MARGGAGSKPGYTGHRMPDWSNTPLWGKGSPGIQGGRRGRGHILDSRTKQAPPVGADVLKTTNAPKKAASSVSPFSGGTL